MKKNEIRTDEEAPLTTPVDASVLEYYRPSPEVSSSGCMNLRRVRKSFFRKREKAKAFFFFYKKKSLLLLLSYLFFNSKVTPTRSIHKYTHPVMLTHYSPTERLTPICHPWSQAYPNTPPRFEQVQLN